MSKKFIGVLVLFFLLVQSSFAHTAVCDFESVISVPLTLNSTKTISSKDAVEGSFVDFVVKNDVYYGEKLLVKRGTVVAGRVETVATQGMNGIPAMIILDEFQVPGLDKNKLKSYFIKRGINLTYLVLPLKWALTPLPPTGSLTNFIIGGTAKIKPNHDIVLKYYPEWKCVE